MARGDPGNAAKGMHAALTPSLALCVGGSPWLGSMSTALLIFKLRLHSPSSGRLGFFAQRGRDERKACPDLKCRSQFQSPSSAFGSFAVCLTETTPLVPGSRGSRVGLRLITVS